MNFRGGHRGGGLRRKKGIVDGAAVDLTPLIDVTFQLLIFFLLTATFNKDAAFKVKLPKASSNQPTTEAKAVLVEISEHGRFSIDQKAVDEAELQRHLCTAAREAGASTVNVRADQNARHERVVHAIDTARTCGIDNIGILHRR